MDSIDVMTRLAKLLNEAREAGYTIWQSSWDSTFYVGDDHDEPFAEVDRNNDGTWEGRVAPP